MFSAFYIDMLSMYVWALLGKISKFYTMKSKPQVLTLRALYTFIFLSIYTAKASGIKLLLSFARLRRLSADNRMVIQSS